MSFTLVHHCPIEQPLPPHDFVTRQMMVKHHVQPTHPAAAVQVLFNMQPVSYTRACSTTTPAQLLENATPPGTTVPAGTAPPDIVRRLPALLFR